MNTKTLDEIPEGDEYNMIWFIYSDYLKESIKIKSYIKFIKWYVWLILALILLIDIGLYTIFILYNIYWILLVLLCFSVITGMYFGNEVRKIIRKKLGTYEDIYWSNITTLRSILRKRKITSIIQINLILEQIDLELPKIKTSDSVLEPVQKAHKIGYKTKMHRSEKW